MAKSYTPAPRVPSELLPRYKVMLEVLSGAMTVSEGARRLGLSRNHFQSLMHRGLAGLLEALRGKPSGRPSPPGKERQLREESARLKRENERLRKRAETTDRLLGLASGLLKGRMDRGKRRSDKRDAAEDG
jgi:transposase-like protein